MLVPQFWSAPIMKWRFSKPADIGTMLKPISNPPGNGGLTIFNRHTWTKTCNLRNNYFTSSDPRPDTYLWLFLTYHLEIYIYMAYYMVYIIFWHSILAFYLVSILTSYLASFVAPTLAFSLSSEILPVVVRAGAPARGKEEGGARRGAKFWRTSNLT